MDVTGPQKLDNPSAITLHGYVSNLQLILQSSHARMLQESEFRRPVKVHISGKEKKLELEDEMKELKIVPGTRQLKDQTHNLS